MTQTLGLGQERAGAMVLARPSEAGGGGWPLASPSISLPTLGLGPCQLSEGDGRMGRTAESGHVLVLLLGRGGLVLRAGTLAASTIRSLPGCSWQTR